MERFLFHVLFSALLLNFCYGIRNQCPEPEKVKPCICKKTCTDCLPVITCSNIRNIEELQDIFKKTGDTPFSYSVFLNTSVLYFPATSLETKRFISLSIVNSSLSSLLDQRPSEASLLQELTLHNLRLQRGFQWDMLTPLHSLRSLTISDTGLRRLDDSFGLLMPKQIKIIQFTNTKTIRIARQAFAPLKNLEHLAIRSTLIKTLDRNMFARPFRAKILDLSDNKIESLPPQFFADMPNLAGIHLNKNNITVFDESVFGNLPQHIQYVSVRDNPIKCDCSIKWITSRPRMPYIDGKCTGPEQMMDKRIRQLKKEDFAPC